MATVQSAWVLIKETIAGFNEKNGSLLAGAIAFQTILSIAPLMIFAVASAGVFLGMGAARQEVSRLLESALGKAATTVADHWIDGAARSPGLASVVGSLLLLLGAASLFSQLKNALNQIWNVAAPRSTALRTTIWGYVRERLLAFVMVLAVGPLLLVIFASRTLLFAFNEALLGPSIAGTFAHVAQFLLSVVIVMLISGLVFRLVPDGHASRRAAWFGALVASVLFNLGNVAIGLYLARVATTEVYGAAGSVVVMLVWLEYSAQAFLLGAEFTQVYARHFGGSRSSPRASTQASASQQV